MSKKCQADGFSLRTERMGKLKDQDIIYVSITDNLESCAKIDTRTIIETDGSVVNLSAALYNAANVPLDQFGCSENKCANTGTYQGGVTTAGEAVTIGDFKKTMDGTLYAGGIITCYFLLPDGNHELSLDIADYTDDGWTNYNTVTKTVHATQGAGASALYPVVFDLSDLSKTTGTGWSAGSVGVRLRVHVAGAGLAANNYVGVSSFAFYEGIEELQINQMIALSCINTAGDTINYDVIESGCSYSEYNTNSGTMTLSVTTNSWTPNFDYILPTWHKTDMTMAGKPTMRQVKVVAGTGELAGYGTIQLSDMIENSCGDIMIQTPGCANNSTQLERISSPVPVPFDEGDSDKFIVVGRSYNGDASLGLILVGPQWIGQELYVIYRQEVEADVTEITNEFREYNCKILVPFRLKNGKEEWHEYTNAKITTTGNSISRTDDSTREVQFTVSADENGVKKRIIRLR